MNKQQRKRLAVLMDQLTVIRDELEILMNEEEEKYDNMPDQLRETERGQRMDEAIDALGDAQSSIEDALDTLGTVME